MKDDRLSKVSLLIRIHLLISMLLAAVSLTFIAEATSFEINVLRNIDREAVEPGGKIKVQLTVYVMGNVTGLVITEKMPSGFEISDSKPTPSRYDEAKGEVKWLFYSLQGVRSRILNYSIHVPSAIAEGTYLIEGNWSAVGFNDRKLGMISSTQIRVQKNPSTISCSVPVANFKVGETITISGLVSPAHNNVTIVLTYKKPDGLTINRMVTTLQDGSYSDSYKVDMAGSWSVVANWLGDIDHSGSISTTVTFHVEKEKNFNTLVMILAITVTLSLVALMMAIKLRRRI